MSKGVGATKRKKALKARAKQDNRKVAKKLAQFIEALPRVSEDDLLSFQSAHFGDDSKPDKWFIRPEEAVDYQPVWDDGLGWYEDGVKRTLTDEEIAVFRRTEEWQLERAEEIRRREAEGERVADGNVEAVESKLIDDPVVQADEDFRVLPEEDLRVQPDEDFRVQPDEDFRVQPDEDSRVEADQDLRAKSPASDVSSLEEDLMEYAGITKTDPNPRTESRPSKSSYPRPASRASHDSRSGTSNSILGSNQSTSKNKRKKKKPRGQTEVPYDQRHKRKWETFIQDQDPIEGSLTHRRLARELDDQKERRVEMDY
ncbi:unnamed protein product [Zymoseptoria tritici ST99CH_1A5]|uniref:Uncharacterized protein n=1 Tax=Zymoseptoria tritici ST99CH_1A5 TaxID=1276529 RepID=A0A1Y6LN85_ZYMTR|nr:unnamed protein product [Zymoseptoria tritici ST99CH_1A5]